MTIGQTWFALHMHDHINTNEHGKSFEERECERKQALYKEETKDYVPISKLKYVYFDGRNHC